ncbi:hypothetical protein RB195_020657 [Necator americanus]|uniref:Uncharacterized protein n=1 Tax=Necator americanus TaxID=51031 RepID=A0ABR1CK47_NECAM
MDHAPSLLSQAEKSVVRRVTRLVKAAIQEDTNATASNGTSKWVDSYKSLLTIKKALDERAKQPGAKVYDFRMFDLVIGNSKPTRSKGEKSIIPPIVQDAYNLIHTLEGKSKEVGDSSNIKFLSPRFAPIMPDKADIRGSLSPSILSFYKDDTEEQLLPIPKLLDATGMNESDREDVLETVMEMTGARQIIDDAMKTLSSTELFGMQGELQEVTNRLTKIFTNLEKTFNRKQKKDMKKRGFTFLETNQLEELHGEQGLAKHANDMDFNIQEYGNQTRAEREDSLWLRIAEIAANGTKTRTKRQITWLSVLKPTVLSPYMFSPVFGLTVLGPCVLSPSLFSPLLLNPAVLSPYVLSPAVGMPFILSPYLLSPYVLSPLVMAPFILNPYVLSPNVINPYVLSPLILSPLVLCPDVVSPMIFVPPFLKDAFDIVNSFNGAKNARILSPRFAPLLPDKTTKGFLSPSLFPFYKDETEQQIMPVPKLLENAGLNEKDRERVLEMVMEVSGARDTVDKAMKVLQHMSSMGMDEKLFDVNEKIGKAFEQLRSSFTPNQNKDMESKGFTFMEPEQMQKLHRDQIQYEPAILHEMKKYKGLSRRERHEILWETVAEVAAPEQKRIPANCCPEADRSKSLSIRTRLWV